MTAVNLIILIRMGNITDRLVSRARSIVTFDICLREVCVRVAVRYVITRFSRMDSLPIFVTHGAPLRALRVRDSSAIKTTYVKLLKWRDVDFNQSEKVIKSKLRI